MRKWRHYFSEKYILFSLVIIFSLFWVSGGWTDADGKAHINLELFKNRYIIENFGISFFLNAFGSGTLALFSPLVAGYMAVMFLMDKKKSGFSSLEIYRIGKKRYLFESFWCTCTVSGSIYLMAYIVYVISIFFISVNMPVSVDYGIVLKNMICMMFYGAQNTVLAQIMACFLKSRYLTICLPFLFCYLYGRALASVSVKMLNLGHIKWMWILDHISFETVFRKDFYSFAFSGLFIVIGYELYKYLAGLNLKRGI